ncbi:multidrug/hemolysin transport system permease protein [Butyrivibrio sp. ob235]|uniref:ABC transporter permease n=1 Tax=unclassified Butyrivibrio TaxID=2639466 RepID=UPI0003B72170|nr:MULTISPECIES: ABC transporter permease [unclassified Butyrivibrio]SEM30549.1 multidrug/hemolysin transport system permease protein [Butyrivibrio sp. ob235]
MAKFRGLLGLTKRNMMVFFNDKGAIFFSMLTPIIILALYLLFLKNTFVSSLEGAAAGLSNFISAADMDQFVNGLLLTGIISTALLTIPYNALEIIVKDREDKVDLDMISTPVKRWEIILSYFLAAVTAAFLQTMIVLACGIGILAVNGSMYLVASDIVKLVGVIFLGTVSSTAIFMLFMMFFRNMGTCSAFMGILSAVSGFVIGAYIPLSEFNKTIQNVCNLVPATGISILIRNYLTGGVLRHMDESIGGVDNGAFMDAMREVFSFNQCALGKTFSLNQSCIYIIIVTVIFIAAIRLIYPKVYNKR